MSAETQRHLAHGLRTPVVYDDSNIDTEETVMVIELSEELEAALTRLARRQGVSPETLALHALRERFLMSATPVQPQDEWERQLLGAASNCGVSLSHKVVSSEGLYE